MPQKKKGTKKVTTSAKGKANKGKTPIKATKLEKKKKGTKKMQPLSDAFMKSQAYHGSKDVPRHLDNVLKREAKDSGPADMLRKVAALFQKKHGKKVCRVSSAPNLKGVIVRIRHEKLPGKEMRFVTYDTYPGKIGIGNPMFNGSETKTGGVCMKELKLEGLEVQKNKGNYWWFNASKKNEAQMIKFMERVGF